MACNICCGLCLLRTSYYAAMGRPYRDTLPSMANGLAVCPPTPQICGLRCTSSKKHRKLCKSWIAQPPLSTSHHFESGFVVCRRNSAAKPLCFLENSVDKRTVARNCTPAWNPIRVLVFFTDTVLPWAIADNQVW